MTPADTAQVRPLRCRVAGMLQSAILTVMWMTVRTGVVSRLASSLLRAASRRQVLAIVLWDHACLLSDMLQALDCSLCLIAPVQALQS